MPGTRMIMIAVCTVAACALVPSVASAAGCSETWIGPGGSPSGGTSGNWGTAGNWSGGAVPTSTDSVCITAPGTYTVTLTTTTDHYGNEDTANVQGLTLGATSGTQTLVVEGGASDVQGNWYNATNLNVGADGMSIAANGVLDLDATASDFTSPQGGTPGGSANLGVDSASSTPAPLTNAGTIIAQSSDSAWGESINVGGTLTNTGSITDESGTLTFQGQSNLPYVVDNTGAVSIASGAMFTMLAGDGSSFTNDGTFANQGTATTQQTMHWIQSGGSETGNPVDLTGQETLEDSAGTGSFAVTNCAGADLTGTIPAGQTVSVIGGCSGTTLTLGAGNNPPAVVNDGTLILDAPATNGSDAIIQGAGLDNRGTLDSTVANTTLANQLLVPLVNEAGALVNLTGGTLEQTAGTATSNAGTVDIAPGSLWLVQAGSFTNTGTLAPQIASATSLGQVNLTVGSKFNAGGTLAPSLASGYVPATGTEFTEVEMNGGGVTGTFASVTGGFSADYSKETASPPYVGMIYASTPTPTPTPIPAPGPTVTRVGHIGSVAGGREAVKVTVSCPKGAARCATAIITVTVTEHLKSSRLVAVTARVHMKTVVVGRATVSLAAGATKTITVTLNGKGKALLAKYGKLKMVVTVSANGKKLKTATVTVEQAKKKTGR
jgi:hypothetical protein